MPEQNNEADKVVDIFAGVDKAPETAPSTNNPVPRVATAEAQPYVSESVPVQSQSHKKFYIIAGTAVAILLLAAAVVAMIKFNEPMVNENLPDNEIVNDKQADLAPVEVAPEVSADAAVQEVMAEPFDAASADAKALADEQDDKDKDGLTDAEEIAVGTNPEKADSDADGLFDYDEVKKFGTDPLNADTDGDSYLDGEEILGGYNPKGAGKLLNFEAELEKMKTK